MDDLQLTFFELGVAATMLAWSLVQWLLIQKRIYAFIAITLGFFIAKTLLERSGATVDFENRQFPDHGAVVKIRWARDDFERPVSVTNS